MNFSPETIGIIGIVVLLVLLVFRVWIGFAMMLVGFLGFAWIAGLEPALKTLANVPYTTLHSYDMSPVPLFIFMGAIVGTMGIGEDLFKATNVWVGHLRGGLTQATTLACAALAAIAGSSPPALVTMGKVAIPEMKKYNYNISLCASSISCAGTLGILIPPSTGFILYSILTQNSIAKLFSAGILPGILLTVLLMVVIAVIYKLRPEMAPAGTKSTFKEKMLALKLVWPVAFLFIMVIGGMYGGILTATEGGAIGVFGAIVITALKRKMSVDTLKKCVMDAVNLTGMIAILLVGSFLMMRFVAVSKMPFGIVEFVLALEMNRYLVLSIIILMYVFLGMFLDVYGAIVLTVPILYPLILALHFDPILFGVIIVIVIEMGLVTPPIGMNAFTLSGITGIPTEEIFRWITPMIAAMILTIILIVIFPQIALFIPNLM